MPCGAPGCPCWPCGFSGRLKMTGKQTGWIYATFPLACIFAPFVSGYLADRWFNAEWIILVCHAVGAVLLFLAARQTKFWGMFWVMLVYCIFFTATLPLVNQATVPPLARGSHLDLLLGACGLGPDRLLPHRPAPTLETERRRSRQPLSGGHPLGTDGRHQLLPIAHRAKARRQSDAGSAGHAQELQLSGLHSGPVGRFRHDAVLLPRHGPIHARSGHQRPECLGGHGHRPSHAGRRHHSVVGSASKVRGVPVDVCHRRPLLVGALRRRTLPANGPCGSW